MRILGIDPGSIICGYGVVEKQGNNISLIEYGVINLRKISPELHIRLKEIYMRIQRVIINSEPQIAAIEATFFAKNAQSLIKLSQARAAAMLSCTMANLDIAEFSAKEIKKSVTGNGNASKEQVSFLVRKILKIPETPEFLDATDALAVALCQAYRQDLPTARKSSSWSDFIAANPDRVMNIQ